MKHESNKSKKNVFILCAVSSGILFLAACSACRPVLYPNKHYREVGSKRAREDVQAAIDSAKRSGLDDSSSSNRTLAESGSKRAASTGVSTAVDVASGGIGPGTVIGAGGSGIIFLIDWMFSKKAPRPLFKKHVELTLRRQGYQVLGWK